MAKKENVEVETPVVETPEVEKKEKKEFKKPKAEVGKLGRVTAAKLNVRTTPEAGCDIVSNIVTKLYRGDEVIVFSEVKGIADNKEVDFYEIRKKDDDPSANTLYVMKEFIELV